MSIGASGARKLASAAGRQLAVENELIEVGTTKRHAGLGEPAQAQSLAAWRRTASSLSRKTLPGAALVLRVLPSADETGGHNVNPINRLQCDGRHEG
jgi:hypothetical protein